tara:strand:+ start:16850 stop:18214 length:1365 start_codon:yes stop_codon:yes gene_type:complete
MSVKIKQSINLSNKVVMTQQIQVAIKLLQLNTLDLRKEIDEKLLNNPFLENESVYDYQDLPQQNLSVVHKSNDFLSGSANDDYIEQTAAKNQTLREYLLWQIKMSTLSKIDQLIAYTIIECIDDSGFLTISLDEIFVQLNKNEDINYQEIFAVLHKIQHLDPIGVGASSLCDCLLIQLEHYHKDNKKYNKAKNIVQKLENNLETKLSNFKTFSNEIQKIKDDDKDVVDIIISLNPKPGNIISSETFQEHITPDVITTKKDGAWVVELNSEINPKIKINKMYEGLLSDVKNKKDLEYIKSNLQDAKFFLKALNNRNLTIHRVAKVIMKKQEDFLTHGEIALKPLVLRDISSILNLHESTISRSTSNKYIQTPRGVYELKYFFSSEIKTDYGKKLSSITIKEMIKKLINNEDARSPLSDSQISKSFSDNGIKVARRTITKYRESMSIPSSTDRRLK